MKIAFIVDQFPKLSETFILNQITGLIDMGHEVDIFAASNPDEHKVHRGVKEYQLLARTYYFSEPEQKLARLLRATLTLLRTFHRDPGKVLRSFIAAKRFRLRRRIAWQYVLPFLGKRYDIIHCHFGPNGFIGTFLKELGVTGKVVVSFHGYDLSLLVAGNPQMYNNLFKSGDLMMPVSQRFQAKLTALGCAETKVIVHRSGVNLAEYPVRKRYYEKGGALNLLTIARLVEKKGLEYSLQAVARLVPKYPRLMYRIGGDGPLRPELEFLAHQLGLGKAVIFLGAVEHDEVKKLMVTPDIFVLSSVTGQGGDEEGIPTTLMEALASGMPVISTIHAGIPELVTDGVSGFLVLERDVDALVARLEYLIQHPEIWQEIGRNGRRFVEERFNIRQLNERLVEIYHALLTEEFAFSPKGETWPREDG
jgi:colanic acid/amylovoran biosynthesis glycosyltransferase